MLGLTVFMYAKDELDNPFEPFSCYEVVIKKHHVIFHYYFTICYPNLYVKCGCNLFSWLDKKG